MHAIPYTQSYCQDNVSFRWWKGNLLPRLFPKLFRSGHHQRLLFCLNWVFEVFICGYKCIFGTRRFEDLWNNLRFQICANFIMTNPVPTKVLSQSMQLPSFSYRWTLWGSKEPLKCNWRVKRQYWKHSHMFSFPFSHLEHIFIQHRVEAVSSCSNEPIFGF